MGFQRIDVAENSFATFIRNYPLKEDNSPVVLYDQTEKPNQSAHIAVFAMDMVPGDLQQCADSIMRMYAKYYYNQKQYNKIAFHFVNGFLCDFETWANGYRVDINGNNVSWVKKADYDNSESSFEKYLRIVFSYASTLSMKGEGSQINIDDMVIGDVFLKAGSPGHVVMVVDICKNKKGEKAFLLAQGYMPAQEFHILKNPNNEDHSWYYQSEVIFPFVTPEYIFNENSFYHLNY